MFVFPRTNSINCISRHFAHHQNVWCHVQSFDLRRLSQPRGGNFSYYLHLLSLRLIAASARPTHITVATPPHVPVHTEIPSHFVSWVVDAAPCLAHFAIDLSKIALLPHARKEITGRVVQRLNRKLVDTLLLCDVPSEALQQLFSSGCPNLTRLYFDGNDIDQLANLARLASKATQKLRRFGLIYADKVTPSLYQVENLLEAAKEVTTANSATLQFLFLAQTGGDTSLVSVVKRALGFYKLTLETFDLPKVRNNVRNKLGISLSQLRLDTLSFWAMAAKSTPLAQMDTVYRECHPVPTRLLCAEFRHVALHLADILSATSPAIEAYFAQVEWLSLRVEECHVAHGSATISETELPFCMTLVLILVMSSLVPENNPLRTRVEERSKRLLRDVSSLIRAFHTLRRLVPPSLLVRFLQTFESLVRDGSWWSGRDANEIVDNQHAIFVVFEGFPDACEAFVEIPSMDFAKAKTKSGTPWLLYLLRDGVSSIQRVGTKTLLTTVKRMASDGAAIELPAADSETYMQVLTQLDFHSAALVAQVVRFPRDD